MSVRKRRLKKKHVRSQAKFNNITNPQTQLTEKERELFKSRHILYQDLGRQTVEPRIHTVDMQPGDRILVCTDGISDNLTDNELKAILNRNKNNQTAVDELIESSLAISRSGQPRAKRDDMSAVIIGEPYIDKKKATLSDITGAESFTELFDVLNQIGGIQGSSNFYNSTELQGIINDVRKGKAPLNAITRSGGLRDTVLYLLEVAKVKEAEEILRREKYNQEKVSVRKEIKLDKAKMLGETAYVLRKDLENENVGIYQMLDLEQLNAGNVIEAPSGRRNFRGMEPPLTYDTEKLALGILASDLEPLPPQKAEHGETEEKVRVYYPHIRDNKLTEKTIFIMSLKDARYLLERCFQEKGYSKDAINDSLEAYISSINTASPKDKELYRYSAANKLHEA